MLLNYLTIHARRSQLQRPPVEKKCLTVPQLFAKLKINVPENAPAAPETTLPTAPPAAPPTSPSTYSSIYSSSPSSSSGSSPEKQEPMPSPVDSPVESDDEGVCCFERRSVSPVASETEEEAEDAVIEEPRKSWAERVQYGNSEGATAGEANQEVQIEPAVVPETKPSFPEKLMGKWRPVRRFRWYKNNSRLELGLGAGFTFEKVVRYGKELLRTNFMSTQEVAIDRQWRWGERWRSDGTRLMLDLSVTESEDNMHSTLFYLKDGKLRKIENEESISMTETQYVLEDAEPEASV